MGGDLFDESGLTNWRKQTEATRREMLHSIQSQQVEIDQAKATKHAQERADVDRARQADEQAAADRRKQLTKLDSIGEATAAAQAATLGCRRQHGTSNRPLSTCPTAPTGRSASQSGWASRPGSVAQSSVASPARWPLASSGVSQRVPLVGYQPAGRAAWIAASSRLGTASTASRAMLRWGPTMAHGWHTIQSKG
jgi:hypothetical protein